jgi:hypothetical protein
MPSTTWVRDHDGWRRDDWLVRKAIDWRADHEVWQLCKIGADGNLRVLDEGARPRGLMDHANLSDGI